MVLLMPLPPYLASKIQIGLIFLVLAYSGHRGKDAIKWMSVCLIKLLLVKASDRDRNIKGKNVGCVVVLLMPLPPHLANKIQIGLIFLELKNMFHDTLLVASYFLP